MLEPSGFILFILLVISESDSMHGLPCSSLGHCFGNPADVNTDPAPSMEANNSRQSSNNHELPAADPVISQPEALPDSPQELQHKHLQRAGSCTSARSSRTRKINGTNPNSVCHTQDKDDDPYFESPPLSRSPSEHSDIDILESECSPELELKYTHIPRPSIVIRHSEVRILWPPSQTPCYS